MIKKVVTLLISFFLFTFSIGVSTKAAASVPAPVPGADSAVLMDADSGQILYSKNMNSAYPPASTTKVLTTLITLEKCKLDEKVTLGTNPPRADGSQMGVKEGEILTVEDLLYGLNLVSGNDCAVALAEHIAGSCGKFAQLMNERAAQLGCTSSHFMNPNGLYDPNHKTSAKDLALILRELTKHPEYYKIAQTLQFDIPPTNKVNITRHVWNEDKIIQPGNSNYYKYAVAGKTGYTIQSKHSYVAIAKKNGRTLIVTLVHAEYGGASQYQDAAKLFNYGFDNFQNKKIITKGQKIEDLKLDDKTTIPLVADSDFFYTIKNNESLTPTTAINVDNNIKNKTFNVGDQLGQVNISANGKLLGSVKLVSGTAHLLNTNSSSSELASNKSMSLANKVVYIAIAAIILISASVLLIRRKKWNG